MSLVLFFGGDAFAGVTPALPGLASQGGFFKIVIKEDGKTQSEFYTIGFAGSAYKTFLDDGGRHIVFVPVGVDVEPGSREIAVYQGDGVFLTREYIEVKRVNFPKSAKIFQRPPYTKIQLARLKKEQELLKNIYSANLISSFLDADLIFRLPLGGEIPQISSEFGAIRKIKIGKDPKIYIVRHYGVDYPVSEGTHVFAVKSGIVRFAGDLLGAGKTIIMDHGYGIFSVYEHLSTTIVLSGDFVRTGQVIAYSGKTGNATGPNLHFGVKLHNIWVNPKYFLGGTE